MECSSPSSSVVQILPPCCTLLDFNLYSFPFYYVLFFSLSLKSNTGCQSCLSLWTSPWMSPTVSSCRIIKAFFWFLVGVVWRRKSIFIHLEWVTSVALLRSDVVLVFLAVTELLIGPSSPERFHYCYCFIVDNRVLRNYILFVPFP